MAITPSQQTRHPQDQSEMPTVTSKAQGPGSRLSVRTPGHPRPRSHASVRTRAPALCRWARSACFAPAPCRPPPLLQVSVLHSGSRCSSALTWHHPTGPRLLRALAPCAASASHPAGGQPFLGTSGVGKWEELKNCERTCRRMKERSTPGYIKTCCDSTIKKSRQPD